MKEKPITVYLSEGSTPTEGDADWSFLYPKPTNLFSDLSKERAIGLKTSSFLTCPAFSSITKKIIQYKSPMDFSYEFDFRDQKNIIVKPLTERYIAFDCKSKSLEFANAILFKLEYHMFADEPLEVMFTAPYFGQSKYTQYATVIPGKFDIGNWFRPYHFEVQPWNTKGEIHIKENEPLFYAHFQTDREINIKRFSMNKELMNRASACVKTTDLFGRGQSLLSRYNRFRNIGMREKVLSEIKKNLVE